LTREFKDNWSMTASYTKARRWGNSTRGTGYDTVFENPNNLINSYGLLPGYVDDEFKMHGIYELPTKTRISATFAYLSGDHWTPTTRTRSRVSGAYRTINLEPRGSMTYDSNTILDLRVTQVFPIVDRVKGEVFAEVFNLLNDGAADGVQTSARWEGEFGMPTSVLAGRRLRLGCRITF
jgi:hypothetical protein